MLHNVVVYSMYLFWATRLRTRRKYWHSAFNVAKLAIADNHDNNKSISFDFRKSVGQTGESWVQWEIERGLKSRLESPVWHLTIAGGHGAVYTLVAVCARFASKRRISIGFVGTDATAEFRRETPSSSGNVGVTRRVCVLLLSNRAETVALEGSSADLQGCWPFHELLWLSRRRYIHWIPAVVKAVRL